MQHCTTLLWRQRVYVESVFELISNVSSRRRGPSRWSSLCENWNINFIEICSAVGAHAYTDASILLPGSLNIFKRFSCQNPSTHPCLSDSKIYEFRSWKAKLRRKKNARSIATLEIGNPILPKENFPMWNISKQSMNVGWHMCAHNVTAINPIRLSDMQGWQLFVDPLLHSVPNRTVHRNSGQRCCETAHNWFCGQKSSVSEICSFLRKHMPSMEITIFILTICNACDLFR